MVCPQIIQPAPIDSRGNISVHEKAGLAIAFEAPDIQSRLWQLSTASGLTIAASNDPTNYSRIWLIITPEQAAALPILPTPYVFEDIRAVPPVVRLEGLMSRRGFA